MRMDGKAVMKCLRHSSTSAVQSTCRWWGPERDIRGPGKEKSKAHGNQARQAPPANCNSHRCAARCRQPCLAGQHQQPSSTLSPRTLARRMRPSASGYLLWISSVTASHVGASRWHLPGEADRGVSRGRGRRT